MAYNLNFIALQVFCTLN